MVLTTVIIKVKPEHVDQFKDACSKNHELSVQEPGNMRFDVLQSYDDPCSFMLYEAYKNANDAAAHKNTAHYAAWRDAVAPWMAEPRKGISWKVLNP